MSDNDTSESTHCSTSCTTSEPNCMCTPCSGTNITIGNNTITQLPLLSKKIYSCYSYNTAQNMLALNQSFQLVPSSDVSYVTGDQICINTIEYSNNSIGVIDQPSFFFNGNIYSFNLENPISYCNYNVLGNLAQQEVADALAAANNTIELITNFPGDQTPADALNSIALSAANADLLTSTALNTIAETQYPADTRTPLEDGTVKVSEALLQHAQAEQVVVNALIDPSNLAQSATDEQSYINASAALINQAASIVLSYTPPPSSTILSLAQKAITDAANSVTLMNEAVATPTFNNLIPPLILGSYALSAIIDALGRISLSTSGDTALTNLLASMELAVNAMTNTHLGIEAANDGDTSIALEYFYISSVDNINALTLIDVESTLPIYNVFESAKFRQKCCDCSSFNSLFLQTSPQFYICSLDITITGTIGGCPFTAYKNNANLVQLSTLGYTPTQLSLYLCIPCNSYFTIYETINNSFSINCIIPTGNYDASTPNTINTNIISSLCSNYEVSVLTKEPISAFVNTSLECSDNNNNNNNNNNNCSDI